MLRARFPAAAPPLDDARCCDLHAGTPLCVSFPLSGGLLKFYNVVLVTHVTMCALADPSLLDPWLSDPGPQFDALQLQVFEPFGQVEFV
ncbi:unnamed protein product [Urochloa humidicola]